MCALLVGLPDVIVMGVSGVMLIDLPSFGRPARLVWRKQMWRCAGCGYYWCDDNPEIATSRCVITTWAARWVTVQVGRHGRSVSEVASDLGYGWHAVMDAVVAVGEQLIEHPDRIGQVTALRLDETLFARAGRFRRQFWSTQIFVVRCDQLLDVVPGRDSYGPCQWLAARDDTWRASIGWATLDMSASYRTVFDTMLSDAVQVANPFHVVHLANRALEECRRRVQNEPLGHLGHRPDPLWRARRRLLMARERLTGDQHDRLMGLLAAGDPQRGVWFAWNAREVVRQIYDHTDPELAVEWIAEIARAFTHSEMPLEVRRLGRTINR